jgi:ATP-dependent DNA ligase
MRRGGPFVLVAFDVLTLNGKDVRVLPLVERKKLLTADPVLMHRKAR